MRAVYYVAAFVSVVALSLVAAAVAITIINKGKFNVDNENLAALLLTTSQQQTALQNIADTLLLFEGNVSDAFNTTTYINNTLNADIAFLLNYTCEQIERINNVTPPCSGDFFLNTTGGLTHENATNGVILNGTAYVIELNQQQTTIDFITSLLSATNAELALLDSVAIKTINNVTVDANGNINITGECGVDINASSTLGILVSTCRIEQNISYLVVFLNETYISILNQTDIINATFISIRQILIQLQSQIDALNPLLVTNINGVYPDSTRNVNITAGPGISVSGVTISNAGVIRVNGINLNRNVDIVAGAGIQVDTVAPDNITISSTMGSITLRQCVSTSVAPILFTTTPSVNTWVYDGITFTGVQKTFPACPDVFTMTTFVQPPSGIWALKMEFFYNSFLTFNGVCLPFGSPYACSYGVTYGLINSNTGKIHAIQSLWGNMRFGSTTIGNNIVDLYIVGQIVMDSNVITPGTAFLPIRYISDISGFTVPSAGFLQENWGGVFTVTQIG
jgi:hypothetical protein